MLILLNKPYGVLTQFTDSEGRETLADYVDLKGVYPAGRLDRDSEGLLLLTDDGPLQAEISHPKYKKPKCYWVQVEGEIDVAALEQLRQGVLLKDGKTRPAKAEHIEEPELWPRNPPVRFRKEIPTSWLALTITEGRNRQVRRMTAAVGFPTLRLVRYSIGDWTLNGLAPGQWREIDPHQGRNANPIPVDQWLNVGGVVPTVGVPLEMRYLLLLGLLLTSIAHAGGEPEFQIEPLQRQAIAGDAYAQLNLGAAFDNGLGVRRDHGQAFYWYRAAAVQGVAEAQFNLGHLYASGLGVPQNYRMAAEWLERAAEQGVVDAAYLLGVIHRDGLGVEPDFGVAQRWFSQAARGGQSDAARALQALIVK